MHALLTAHAGMPLIACVAIRMLTKDAVAANFGHGGTE